MPTLHVVGEILGASGLGSGGESSAFASVVDCLRLHPASDRSFFCRWRLLPGDPKSARWEVLEGEVDGQTQSHAMSGDVPAMKTGKRDDQLMDLIWAHPIDLHLATPDPLGSWPHLEFQVCGQYALIWQANHSVKVVCDQIWSFDCFHQEHLCTWRSLLVSMASTCETHETRFMLCQ